MFGLDSVDIGARAVARHGSYTGWSTNLAPWTLTQDQLVFGQTLDLKVVPGNQYAPGNFGAINLIVPGKSACVDAQGANDYRDLIENDIQSCLVEIGDQLDLKTGNMAILDAALEARGAINNFDPNSLISTAPNGVEELTKLDGSEHRRDPHHRPVREWLAPGYRRQLRVLRDHQLDEGERPGPVREDRRAGRTASAPPPPAATSCARSAPTIRTASASSNWSARSPSLVWRPPPPHRGLAAGRTGYVRLDTLRGWRGIRLLASRQRLVLP